MSWGKDTRKKLLDEDDEFGEPPVTMETGFAKIIVVDHVPVIPESKYAKLKTVLNKIFSALGTVVQLYFPQEADGTTKGYAFVEYATVEQAQTAIEKTNGYKLDPQHIFEVSSFDDFQKYINTPETYTEPKISPYEARDNPRWWLLDERGVDQYAVRYGEFTEVLWNDIKVGEPPESVVKRDYWSDSYVSWSPQGSYLATMHNEGVAVWGGSNWTKVARFPHPGVKLIDFSPCEKYLVTASPQYQDNDNPNDPQCIIIWNVRTGEKLRGFQATQPIGQATWPVFKWSFDDKYFARLTEDTISIYETPSMGLLDKKSIKIPGVKDFSWSPTENLLSYSVGNDNNNNNKPASVVILEIPARKEKRIKNLFSVGDCKLYWQSLGDYLVAKIDRTSKSKKSAYTDFEIFRLREKDIPIDHFEIKEGVSNLAFEPRGTKFAVIHGEGPKFNVSFYSVEGKFQLLKTLEKKSCNTLLWSPQGGFIVLAGLGTLNGVFEFYNAIDMESIVTEEHFMATQVEWDPTGRFFSTVVSGWKHQLENGYNIYNFQGKVLRHVLQDKFYQLLWRPRPTPLLSADRINYIKKHISQFAKEMKNEDKQKEEKEKAKKRAKRDAMRKDFESLLAQRKRDLEADANLRKELKIDYVDPADFEEKEQWVEEVVEVTEIVINED